MDVPNFVHKYGWFELVVEGPQQKGKEKNGDTGGNADMESGSNISVIGKNWNEDGGGDFLRDWSETWEVVWGWSLWGCASTTRSMELGGGGEREGLLAGDRWEWCPNVVHWSHGPIKFVTASWGYVPKFYFPLCPPPPTSLPCSN